MDVSLSNGETSWEESVSFILRNARLSGKSSLELSLSNKELTQHKGLLGPAGSKATSWERLLGPAGSKATSHHSFELLLDSLHTASPTSQRQRWMF